MMSEYATVSPKKPNRVTIAPELRSGRTRLTLLTVFTVISFYLFSQPAISAEADSGTSRSVTQHSYNIPSGPLAQVLNQFAQQAGITLSFTPAQVDGKQSAGLQGDYAIVQALQHLLSGTGLGAVRGGGNSYALQAIQQSGNETTLPAMMVEGQIVGAGASTEGTGSYASDNVTIGKAQQSLREIPQSVSVLTRERMDDQNMMQLEDTLDQITGLQHDTSTGPAGAANVTARGFAINNYQYDGVPQTYLGSSFTGTDMAIYDRVEVIRGAAGLLQGSGNPSATVNLVRKKPGHENFIQGEASIGSWEFYRGEVDASGTLTSAGKLRGRFVGVLEDREYYVEALGSDKSILYGVLEYDISPQTLVTAGVNQQRINANPMIWGLPRYSDGSSLDLPRSANLAPAWNWWSQDITDVFANLEHTFDNDWILKVGINSSPQTQDFKRTVTRGTDYNFGVNPANPEASIFTGVLWHSDADRYNLDVNASGQASFFDRTHDFLVGFNIQDYESRTKRSNFFPAVLIPDVFDFDPYSVLEPASGPFVAGTTLNTLQYGVYGSGQFSINDPLTLVLGSRLSWYETRTDNHDLIADTTAKGRETVYERVLTPYAGLLYDVNKDYTVYASYADIFTPQTGQYTPGGDELEPIVGVNYEAGVKAEYFGGAINASFAIFRIDQKNRAQEDIDNPCGSALIAGACYVAEGEVRSEGFEVEVSGLITPDWNIFAGYTFNETEYLKDLANEGEPFRTQTPKHLLKVWTDYRLPMDQQRWKVGGGVNAQSSYYAMNGAVRSEQPAYAVWDLHLGYEITSNISASINVNNVFDETYYSAIRGVDFGNVYGEPRNYMVSIRGKY